MEKRSTTIGLLIVVLVVGIFLSGRLQKTFGAVFG
jgi:hypothetical protein